MCWLARSRRINGMGRKTKDLVHAGILESGPDLVPKLGAWIQRGAQSHDWEVRTKPSSFLMCDYTKHTGNMDESSQNGHILQVQAPPYGLLSESMQFGSLAFLFPVLRGFFKHETSTTVIHIDNTLLHLSFHLSHFGCKKLLKMTFKPLIQRSRSLKSIYSQLNRVKQVTMGNHSTSWLVI